MANLTQKEQLMLAYGEGQLLFQKLNRLLAEFGFALSDLATAVNIPDEAAQRDKAEPVLANIEKIVKAIQS